MTSTSWVLFLWPGLDKNLCWLWINTAVYELCPLLGSMLWKHKPTNRTQTYSETHCVHTHACIIQEECTNKNRVWKRWHFWSQIWKQERSSASLFSCNDFSSGEFGSSHSWYSSHRMKWWVSSPLFTCLQQKKKAERLFPVWNTKSLFLWKPLRHTCLSASMDPHSFWLCCELSPSVSHTPSRDSVLSS